MYSSDGFNLFSLIILLEKIKNNNNNKNKYTDNG